MMHFLETPTPFPPFPKAFVDHCDVEETILLFKLCLGAGAKNEALNYVHLSPPLVKIFQYSQEVAIIGALRRQRRSEVSMSRVVSVLASPQMCPAVVRSFAADFASPVIRLINSPSNDPHFPHFMTASFVIGVLALQGAFVEHLSHLSRAAAESPILQKYNFSFIPVRTTDELSKCHALVIPGGESTAMSLIAERTQMLEPLRQFVTEKPVWGTCAGLIFMASSITNAKPHQQALGGLAVQVARNAFGRQLDSFACNSDFSSFAPQLKSFNTVFIRAPVVTAVETTKGQWKEVGPELDHKANLEAAVVVDAKCANEAPVKVLHELENGLVVAVRQGKHLGTSFHPELANDALFHAWFLEEFVVKEYVQ